MRQILALARAEVLHVIRDKATLAQVIILPVVQLIVLANAATFTIRDTPAFVVDLDHSPASRGLVNRITSSGHFFISGSSVSPEAANDALLAGHATLVVTIPADFESSLVKTGRGSVQLAVNGEKGSTAGIVQSYAANIIGAYARELGTELRPTTGTVRAPGQAGPAAVGRLETRIRGWYNPARTY
jgi:ABC-2 type transport system permease protein